MLHFAIIGCGRIAIRHAENIKRVGILAAVCDIEEEKAIKFAQTYNTQAFTSLLDLLQSGITIDVVVICTPNGFHAEHSIKALMAGKHVLCEKPMSLTTEDAHQMRDTALKYSKKLFVVKQNRYNPPVLFVKTLLDEQKLGKILSFQLNCFWNRPQAYYTGDWRGTKSLDGGLLYTQFSHFIDLLFWLLGDVKNVTGIKENFGLRDNLEIEDSGVAIIRMEDGAIGTLNYTINSYQQNMEGSLSLFGEKGTVKIGGQYLNVLEFKSLQDDVEFINDFQCKPNHYGFYEGSMSNHHKVYDALAAALLNNENVLPDEEEAVKTIKIIEQIYAAIN
jgi:UDP-N-acetyl-2-amino-2-deoxyglucuronate dehydrogenase